MNAPHQWQINSPYPHFTKTAGEIFRQPQGRMVKEIQVGSKQLAQTSHLSIHSEVPKRQSIVWTCFLEFHMVPFSIWNLHLTVEIQHFLAFAIKYLDQYEGIQEAHVEKP